MPRTNRNHGFTLVELLIVIAVTGVIVTALSSSIVFIIRNMETSNNRVAATTDEQNLVTWLPVDVSSAANLLTPESFALATDTAAVSGCASPSAGTNVLLLNWTESVNGTTTNFVANYRSVPEGTGMRLKRNTCSGVSVLGAASVQNVSNVLPALPVDWAPGSAPVAVTRDGLIVKFELTQSDGRITSVESSQKNPSATLPPVPTTITPTETATTMAPTTTTMAPTTTVMETTTVVETSSTVEGETTTVVETTEAPTTTVAPTTTTTIPCVVTSVTLSDDTPNTHSRAPNLLQDDVIVTITKTGPCQLIQLEYDTGGSQGLLYQNFPSTGPFTVTLRGFRTGGTEVWTAGPHTLKVIDNNKAMLNSIVMTVS